MTDRELLELAAKAAGLRIDQEATRETGRGIYIDDDAMTLWNPLTDDGDALRLAVKLHMMICHRADGYINAGTADTMIMFPVKDTEPCEAVRYAIVRAAAEIGRSLSADR